MKSPILKSIIRHIKRAIRLDGGVTPTIWTPVNRTVALWAQVGDKSTVTFDDTDPDIINDWDDKSGNGRHLHQTTTGRKPSIEVVNGVNGIFMDGINDRMDCDTYSPSGSLTVYIAASNGTTSNADKNIVCGTSIAGGDAVTGFSVHNGSEFLVGDDQRAFHIEGQLTSTADEYTNGTTGNATVPQDQAAIFSARFDCVDSLPNIFRIGSYADGAIYGDAIIYEIILVAGHDSDAEMRQVEGYMAWGLEALGLVASLDASHPYKNAPPMV